MRITVGELRSLVREAAMDQAKLGIASSYFPDSVPADEDDMLGDRPFIIAEPTPTPAPDPLANKAWNDHILKGAKAGLEEPWDADQPLPLRMRRRKIKKAG